MKHSITPLKRASSVLHAVRRGRKNPNARPLLPPLQLYRRILREHKNLPALQRELGDNYVKSEFKLHKNTDNPLHIVGFLASWQDYLHLISKGEWLEGSLTSDVLEKLSPEQVVQLYELMRETQQVREGEGTNEDPEKIRTTEG
ncbi:Sdh7p TDEL_0C06580 [Torulaspora delbrueckii]|uniref:Succinate dehydrogenase assembly factor 3 n=1 Tax=Torulaspora delbrueckii TaxID=4950 RepID=G8ZQR0_TORDE|nr:hypothetical protein TDEL_0C06580 [Torulaspora delbrueckii]CCE91547.1 hypothetical protein TDEL_0C06580 [Torulaspora delbrueckii]